MSNHSEEYAALQALSALSVVVSHSCEDTLKAAKEKLEAEEKFQSKMADAMLSELFMELFKSIRSYPLRQYIDLSARTKERWRRFSMSTSLYSTDLVTK
jgi:hypothetical protein